MAHSHMLITLTCSSHAHHIRGYEYTDTQRAHKYLAMRYSFFALCVGVAIATALSPAIRRAGTSVDNAPLGSTASYACGVCGHVYDQTRMEEAKHLRICQILDLAVCGAKVHTNHKY